MAYKLTYNNRGTRNLPLSPEVARIYELAARAAGIDEIRVTSGGQPSSGPNRTGSHRHDEGGAGDIQLVKNGRVMEFTNPEDTPYFQKWIGAAKGGGLTGFGAGTDYMGNNTIHAGGGAPAIWGAGGSGSNAPDWLRQAYGTTINSNPVTSPISNAAVDVASDVAPSVASGAPATAEQPFAEAFGGLEQMIGGLQGKKPKQESTEQQGSKPQLQPNTPNPQMAQGLLQELLNRNKPRNYMSGFGIL